MPFNFFQKFSQKKGVSQKSPANKPAETQRKPARLQTETIEAQSSKESSVPAVSVKKQRSELADQLLSAPHISEKATLLQTVRSKKAGPSYVFRVAKGATKLLLKKSIEDRYDVKVLSVRVINTNNKLRRRGNIQGVRPGFKKTIATLGPGESIDEF